MAGKKPCREDRGVRQPHPGQEFPMSIDVVSPLRQRMIEDMTARKLGAGTQRLHISSCKRFVAFLQRSPDTATVEDIRCFQLHLAETGTSIPNRHLMMTGLRSLFRLSLRRLALAADIYHLREPQKIHLPTAADCVPAKWSGSRSSTSTARRRSFASSRARAARIAMSCSHPSCSICCGNGGESAHRVTMREHPLRNVGCFQAGSLVKQPASR